ncbi:MAG: DUF1572 family protein [Acidobacteriota bacterium]|nr:DUF1572 family protein [Acidobacteriota bacterium]
MERQIAPGETILPSNEFLAYSRFKLFEQYWPRLQQCLRSLTPEQLWWRPNAASNSIGNLLLHLSGNVRQWMVASFNGESDERNRPDEFSRTDGDDGIDPLAVLNATMVEAEKVLQRLTESDLTKLYSIQGYTVSGLGAVYQVVEHFGLHYGQIVYITKMLTAEDLGFYKELTKTGRAS